MPRVPIATERTSPPGSTDIFSSERSFCPPIGSRFDAADPTRGYYIDFRLKTDRPTWPPAWLKPRDQQLHVGTVQWALGAWERHVAGEGDRWHEAARAAADYLLSLQETDGRAVGGWTHLTPMPHTYRLDPPWLSGIVQGEAASLFVRLHAASGDEKYAEGARRAVDPLATPVDVGGVLGSLDGLPFLEEYPTRPPSHVLNGAFFALWGCRDVALALSDSRAHDLYERGIDALATMIHRYDTGSWSRYDLYPHPLPNLASAAYHLLHIRQLTVAERLGGRDEFAAVRRRFDGYRDARLMRWRAFGRKVAFRLLVPRTALLAHRLPWNARIQRRAAITNTS